jgi:hypothetical protein
MSFGTSIGDCILLAQLAWNTFQGAKEACGENNELTREVSSLYKALNRLQKEVSNPTSFVSRANNERREELEEHAAGCREILKVMDAVLKKYNALEGNRPKQLWQKIKFGNGEMKNLAEIRIKLSAHTSAIMMSLNMCSLDSLGRVEETLGRVEAQSSRHGHHLRGIRKSLHWVTANMAATGGSGSGSVWTSYTNDDKSFWRELRRELVNEGYDSAALQKHKKLIKAYVEELGNRGVFDEPEPEEAEYSHVPEHRTHRDSGVYMQLDEITEDVETPESTEPDEIDGPLCSLSLEEVAITPDVKPEITPIIVAISGHPDAEELSESKLTSEDSIEECVDTYSTPPPIEETRYSSHSVSRPKSPYAVQIEEVVDEEFAREAHQTGVFFDVVTTEQVPACVVSKEREHDDEHLHRSGEGATEEASDYDSDSAGTNSEVETGSDPQNREKSLPQRVDLPLSGNKGAPASNSQAKKLPTSVQIDEVLDDDFLQGAHPNGPEVLLPEAVLESKPIEEDSPKELTIESSIQQSQPNQPPSPKNQSPRKVRFAESMIGSTIVEISPREPSPPRELRFIFFREFRDFDTYQELQESYQALFDEKETAASPISDPVTEKATPTSTFITHSPYTPEATLWDLKHYCIPASYFHKFWHPQRVPIYLHGNVFDGISLTNWIYNWTAYAFRDDSFQMSTVRRFGKTVIKLGSALTDIEHASPQVKSSLPKDLYDQSGTLWAELEDVINDIMSEAEKRLDRSKKGGRLEVEFVSRFFHEMVAGQKYHQAIDKFLKEAEEWCKIVRFHDDFIMLWDTWES